MKKAAFYILADSQLKARDLCACRLAAKAYGNKLKVYIYTTSAAESETINTVLWTFSDISFVPHKIHTAEQGKINQQQHNKNIEQNSQTGLHITTQLPAVLIGDTPPPPSHNNDVLINLNFNIPNCVADFSHVIEIIPDDENWKQIARKHYKYYKQQNYELVTHKL